MATSSAECLGEPRFVRCHLLEDRLLDVEAMHDKRAAFVRFNRKRAGQEALQRAERTPRRAWSDANRKQYETGSQRQARVEHAPGDVEPGEDRLPQENEC
jgi:hypothetical protein